jgi:hypothetical protein
MAQVGFEPTASLGLNKSGLPVAYRAISAFSYQRSAISAGGRTRTYIRWFKASKLAR